MKVEISGDEKKGFELTITVPIDTNLVKPVQGKKFDPEFKLGDMRPSSTGKTLFLYNDKVQGVAKHPLFGDNLTIPLRIEMPTPKEKGIRKMYQAWIKNADKDED